MNYLNGYEVKNLIQEALREDIAMRDITTELLVPKDLVLSAQLVAEEELIVCGISIAAKAFKLLDKNIKFKPLVKDGQKVKEGMVLAVIKGRARSILSAERVALNFLSLLSGTATQTRIFVNAIKPYKAKILDTRKTIPGLRLLQKYAVRCGGGYNHRFALDEMVLVKDNHLEIIGGCRNLRRPGSRLKIEIEVKSLKELEEALKLKPDMVMLDNMSVADMKKAVQVRGKWQGLSGKVLFEASGNIDLKNVKKVAATGVDMISIGSLTHSVDSADISLDIRP
ncbi:MAG: carboxylating nicotinate-nucleotide diphosphorylase [Candidatus Omnitrophica bacterium]|nr:carboxylating nicotinate-nucleotide diphosphorylase [Candidatus Omnitrophota bacterium]